MLADRIFGAPEREPPPKRRRKPAARSNARGRQARGRRPARGRRISAEEARQRRMDLLGLCCMALAIYLGYVIYLGWDGGSVGDGTETALAYAVGGGAIAFPVAPGLGGLALILRPLMPSPGALAAGVFAIAAGLLLALAAQTAGLGPDGVREKLFDPGFFPEHGGGAGEVLYWAATTLFQRIGAHIIAVLLLIAGLLLVMGRSVSDMAAAAHRGFARAKNGAADFVTLMRETRGHDTDPDLVGTDPIDTDPVFGPPEPVDGAPVVS